MEPCKIMYSPEYLDTMSALRECLENKTYTEKALQITEDALNLLASHYTAWCFRLEVVKHLGRSLFEELNWCEEMALENEKNYQIWNYRQRIIELIMANPDHACRFEYRREFPILYAMLGLDAKNHHVWLYRNWFVQKFNLYDDPEELAFVSAMIDKDARNNSAWTHRFFLLLSRKNTKQDIFDLEVQYAKDKIALCPQNPSPWNYLLGIYRQMDKLLSEIKDFCKVFADLTKETISSSYALEALARIAVEEGDPLLACQYYDLLLQKYDPMRAPYWNYLKQKIK